MPQHPPPLPELSDDLGFRDHQMGMMIHPPSSATNLLSLRLMGLSPPNHRSKRPTPLRRRASTAFSKNRRLGFGSCDGHGQDSTERRHPVRYPVTVRAANAQVRGIRDRDTRPLRGGYATGHLEYGRHHRSAGIDRAQTEPRRTGAWASRAPSVSIEQPNTATSATYAASCCLGALASVP